MITVYVIASLTDQTWYTGMAKNAQDRLQEHNQGKNRFTKGHPDFHFQLTSAKHAFKWSAVNSFKESPPFFRAFLDSQFNNSQKSSACKEHFRIARITGEAVRIAVSNGDLQEHLLRFVLSCSA